MGRSPVLVGNALLFRAIGYVFPLISIPLYSRWLGSKAYGQLGVVLTFCSLLQALSEFGHTVGGGGRLARASSVSAGELVTASIYSQKIALLLLSLIIGCAYFLAGGEGGGATVIFLCAFFTIVVPDALTPVWIYYAASAVPELAKLQFLSRLLTLPAALLIVWAFPFPIVGASATGMPFLALMVLAMLGVKARLAFPSRIGPVLVQSLREISGHLPFFIGSLAATSIAPLAMQIAYFSDRAADLGPVYLSLSLWTALRQLCMLPHQTNYGRAATKTGRVSERPAFAVATAIAVVTVLASYLIPSSVYAAVFGSRYSAAALLLPRILMSTIPFSVAYGIVLNRIAARNLSFEFSSCYVAAALIFVAMFVPARHVWAVPISLPLALVVSDSALLLSAWVVINRRSATLYAP